MSGLYGAFLDRLLRGELNLATDTLKAVLLRTSEYTPDFESDQDLSDVPAEARVAVSGALTGVTTDGAIVNSDEVTFEGVEPGAADGLLLYDDSHPSDALIALFDGDEFDGTERGGQLICEPMGPGWFSI